MNPRIDSGITLAMLVIVWAVIGFAVGLAVDEYRMFRIRRRLARC